MQYGMPDGIGGVREQRFVDVAGMSDAQLLNSFVAPGAIFSSEQGERMERLWRRLQTARDGYN